MDVDPLRIQGNTFAVRLFIVDRHEHQVDIGLGPDRIVRETPAENRGEDGAIAFHLFD